MKDDDILTILWQSHRELLQRTETVLTSCFSSHRKPSQAVGKHLRNLGALHEMSVQDIEVLAQSHRGTEYLMNLEALWQDELCPTINTKEEWKSQELTIKLQLTLQPRPSFLCMCINCLLVDSNSLLLFIGNKQYQTTTLDNGKKSRNISL